MMMKPAATSASAAPCTRPLARAGTQIEPMVSTSAPHDMLGHRRARERRQLGLMLAEEWRWTRRIWRNARDAEPHRRPEERHIAQRRMLRPLEEATIDQMLVDGQPAGRNRNVCGHACLLQASCGRLRRLPCEPALESVLDLSAPGPTLLDAGRLAGAQHAFTQESHQIAPFCSGSDRHRNPITVGS